MSWHFFRWVGERRFLRERLRGIVGATRVRTRDDLTRIKRHLTAAITFDMADLSKRRPWLRSSAREILCCGRGFCGENARVAISLLRLGGVRANRLYLQGRAWDHTVVEHEWEGGWRLFDAHNDPATILPDELVASIDSEDLSAFPARREENLWVASYRLKLLHRLPILRHWSCARPPALLVAFGESPALVGIAVGAAMTFVGFIVAFWAR